MKKLAPILESFLESAEKFRSLQKDGFFTAYRSHAKVALKTNPWPSGKDEMFKNSFVPKMASEIFHPFLNDESVVSSSVQLENTSIFPNAEIINIQNGQLKKELSTFKAKYLSELESTPEENIINNTLHKKGSTSKILENIMYLFLVDGLFIYIPDVTKKPESSTINIQHIISSITDNVYIPTYIHIFCGIGSQVTFFEDYSNVGNHKIWNHIHIEIYLDVDSNCHIIRNINHTKNSIVTTSIDASVMQHAQLIITSIQIGGGSIRSRQRVDLAGEHAESNINTISLSKDNAYIENICKVDHRSSHTKSSQKFRVVADGNSVIDTDLTIDIPQGIEKITASEQVKGLLLSPKSRIYAKPRLAIYSSDVSVSHGVAIGEMDQKQKQYLSQRGFSESTIKAMLATGFLMEIFDQSTSRDLKNFYKEKITQYFLQAK